MNPQAVPEEPCLCGSGRNYRDCCEPLHAGAVAAKTAEQLMRSRFTAYALRNADYLASTWDKNTRPESIDFSKEDVRWTGLEIVSKKKGQPGDPRGIVEFKAFYEVDGTAHVMREISRFRHTDGRWVYLDGSVRSIGKVGKQTNLGRNAPCPCGSGKKSKRCCGA